MSHEVETTGWVSKLTKQSAWVRLNYTLRRFTEDELVSTAKLFLSQELIRHGRSAEAPTSEQDWYLDRMKYAVPNAKEGRNTVLVYLKRRTQ